MHPALLVLFTYLLSLVINVIGIKVCNKIAKLPTDKLPVSTAFLSVFLWVFLAGCIAEYILENSLTSHIYTKCKNKSIELYTRLNFWCNYP